MENLTNTNDNILVVDEDYRNNLQLLHYRNCDNNSPLYVKECRGIVKKNDKIISKSFGYIDELTVDVDGTENIFSKIHSFNQTKIYPMYEGTILRMFFHKKWYISTHKKLNAFDSKWGSSECKTFGEMFVDSICDPNVNFIPDENESWILFDNFCFQLDTNKTYVFLLLHDIETSMVCSNYENIPSCFHVGEFDNSTHLLLEGNTSGLPSLPVLNFKNTEELIEYVRNINYLINPGVILYFPNQTQLKLFNKNYKNALELRGNQPDILYRYLEIRKNKELSSQFLDLYKNQNQYLMTAELILIDLSKFLFHSYINRYINKKFVYLPKCEHIVLQMCHDWHNQDRNNNKINFNKVFNTLENLPTKMLYSIIKNHI